MGTHTLDELIRLYTLEKITVEQTTGQILQHLQRVSAAFDRMWELEQDAQRIKAFIGIEEESTSKKKDKRRDEAEGEGNPV